MIAYLLFIYILGLIPFILICIANNFPVRDACWWRILFYPVWIIPILMYFVVVLIYCVNWKIIKALERFYE